MSRLCQTGYKRQTGYKCQTGCPDLEVVTCTISQNHKMVKCKIRIPEDFDICKIGDETAL